MPPANSPRNPSPPADQAHTPSFISALRELESPVSQDVLNLAATLTTQADDGDDDDDDLDTPSMRALRLSASSAALDHDLWRLDRSRDRLRLLERQRSELDHRDRLRLVMNRLGRIHDPSTAYGDRIPSTNNLYDWSPANEADDEDELDQILADLRRQHPNGDTDILRLLSRAQLAETRSYIRSLRASNPTSASNSNSQQQTQQPPSQPAPPAERDGSTSLRSAAILQSVRRHPRFSARTREYLQRYNSDRESASRSNSHAESRERYSTETVRQSAMQRLAEGRSSLDRERRDLTARADSLRRSFLERSSNTSSCPPHVAPLLERTIKYLSRIRYSNTREESLNCVLDAGFLSKNYSSDDYADFLLDTLTLPPPAETSWLAPGAVLSGCQYATTVTSTITTAAPGSSTTFYRFRNNDTMTSTTLLDPPHRPWLAQSYSTPRSRSSQLAPEVVTSHSPQQDRWPVKVTIHAVDYSKMSLSATMEAYNVPSHPHAQQSLLSNPLDASASPPFTRTSSITTYLEGEILDFNTHTLFTESFKSSASNDATYWRKLPPFQKLTDDEIVRNLTSRRWFEELNKEWILMRWKERCFVKSLNRSTADPVQPPANSSTASFTPDMPLHANTSFHSSSTRENHYEPSRERDGWGNGDMEHTSFDGSGCGLTISGFYYVCLRRSDGKLEGLYYDPQSSPYQCLKLESVRGGVFPAWGFR